MAPNLSPGIQTREIDFSYYVKHLSTSSAGMVGVTERGPVNKPVLVTSWEQFLNTFGSYIQASYLAYAARTFFDNGGSVLYVNRITHLTDPADRASLTAVKASASLKDQRGIRASLMTGTVGTNRIRWFAKATGPTGADIAIELVAAGTDTPLSVDVTGQAVRVELATDSAGDPVSTTAEVIAAVADTPNQIVEAFANDVGVVQPVPATNLEGGRNPKTAFRIVAINEGTWGDDIEVQIDGDTVDPDAEFHLTVRFRGEVVEVFRDLSTDESATNHVEAAINERSRYITINALATAEKAELPRFHPGWGVFRLSGGVDGLVDLGDADYLGDAAAHTGLWALDEIDALNLLMAPGVTSANVIHGGIAYAENRKDLLFLAETPLHLEPLEAVEFRKGRGMYAHAAFNSSYAALYYPWLEIRDPVNGTRKRIPPCGAVAGCFARSDHKAAVWQAPAGIDRGRITGVLALGYPTSRGERDVLYPEGVNVIVSFPDTGVHIWGQKTLQSQPSALDRVNVRRLMIYIEEAIAESSRFVVFEPNNPETWRALGRLIHPFLQDIRDNGGLYDFAVQCDEETNTPAVIDRNELVARIFVKPTRTAEFVELNFVLTATGADFQEIFTT